VNTNVTVPPWRDVRLEVITYVDESCRFDHGTIFCGDLARSLAYKAVLETTFPFLTSISKIVSRTAGSGARCSASAGDNSPAKTAEGDDTIPTNSSHRAPVG
jgi:hypothetical protein